jgi:hypothetical protein
MSKYLTLQESGCFSDNLPTSFNNLKAKTQTSSHDIEAALCNTYCSEIRTNTGADWALSSTSLGHQFRFDETAWLLGSIILNAKKKTKARSKSI